MNVFELFASITLDTGEYEKQLGEAGSKTSVFGEKLKSGLATAGKVAATGLAAATTAVVALGKSAIEGYAEYEQLVGGVETLFGASADAVKGYAENAYKTAGLSANEYMSTVTSFSASLLQSLGGDTAKAAEVADQAIVDMADNANKMGSSMESIQNAYQGFAKQNYTMLDNLKLGYGGTKEEMQRLLKDAEKLSGKKFDLSSYADVIEAIHVIQEEMGIAGTTAEEATGTISGSAATMKAAWENLLVGIADGSQNVDDLINNLIESVGAFGENIIPRISVALNGIVGLISGLAPQIVSVIPTIVEQVLPQLIGGTQSVISAVAGAIPGIVSAISTVLGQQSGSIVQAGFNLVQMLGQSIIASIPSIVGAAAQIISALATGITENAEGIMSTGVEIISTLATSISENLPAIIPAAVEAILVLSTAMTDPANLGSLVDSAIAIIGALVEGLIAALPTLLAQAPIIVGNLVEAIITNAPKLAVAAVEMIAKLVVGIIEALPQIGQTAGQIISQLASGIVSLYHELKAVGKNIVDGVWQGISENIAWFTEKVKGFFTGIVNGVKETLGIRSPSRVFAEIGGFMAEGLGVGWDAKYSSIKKQIEDGMAFDAKTVDFDVSMDDPVRSRGVHVIQNIYSEAKTAADLMEEAIYLQERAVILGV